MLRISRAGLIHGALLLFAGALVVRAAQVQLWQGRAWTGRAFREHAASVATAVPRGTIFDATGQPVVESHDVVQLSVAPREVRDPRRVARSLAAAGVSPPWVQRALDRRRGWVVIPVRPMPAAAAPVLNLPGVYTTLVADRIRSGGEVANGIDVALDSVLRGDTTSLSLWRDGRGRIFTPPAGAGRTARAGDDVVLTINHALQDICDRALSDAVARMGASGGDIVIVDPHDGAVLAVASRRHDRSGDATAFTEPFEPGSTIKPFIAARLLDLGRVAPTDVVDTHTGEITIEGRTIHDAHTGVPSMSLRDVIRWSSNVGITEFAERLSPREEYEALRDVGFGTPTGVALPSEAGGTLREPAQWSAQSAASLAIGYEIAVTPVQLAMAYAAIANGGELLEPALVREIRAADGTVRFEHQRRVVRRALSARVAAQLRDMLIDPVARGTAVEADLSTFIVAGKTGTARRVEPDAHHVGYADHAYTATFVGLFPARDPQYVILVKIDDPAASYYGGTAAAPVSKTVLEAAIAARDAALDRSVLATRDRNGRDRMARPVGSVRDADSVAAGPSGVAVGIAPGPGAALPPDTTPLDTTLAVTGGNRAIGHPAGPLLAPRAIPDVRALSLRAAVRALHRAGFEVQLVDGLAAGQTEPAASAIAAAGTTVRLGHP